MLFSGLFVISFLFVLLNEISQQLLRDCREIRDTHPCLQSLISKCCHANTLKRDDEHKQHDSIIISMPVLAF